MRWGHIIVLQQINTIIQNLFISLSLFLSLLPTLAVCDVDGFREVEIPPVTKQQQGITHLSCWTHARRYFDKALGNDKERASHVMKLIQLIYAIEALARESGMSHEQRKALRIDKSLPIINEIGQYIYQQKNKVTPQSPIGKAFDYCSNRWVSLQNYLTDGMLEIDSNLVKNSIRPLALRPKNYLFAGSHDAAKDIAMFYIFFVTCTKNDIDPQKWLTYVIKNINDTKNPQLKFLLPQFIDKNLLE